MFILRQGNGCDRQTVVTDRHGNDSFNQTQMYVLWCAVLIKAVIFVGWSVSSRSSSGLRSFAAIKVFNRAASYKDNLGEDAWLTTNHEIGVFDGVGDWKLSNIDAGSFSRSVANYMQAMVHVEREMGTNEIDLVSVLQFAVQQCRDFLIFGSCTACVASIDPVNSILQILNLGDSAAIVLRPIFASNGSICDVTPIFRSSPQYHSYNAPYQIGHFEFSDNSNSSLIMIFDSPKASSLKFIPVLSGDVVIIGSDGLYDNLFENELLPIILSSFQQSTVDCNNSESLDTNSIVAILADNLSKEVVAAAMDRNRVTPWSSAARARLQKKNTWTLSVQNWLERLGCGEPKPKMIRVDDQIMGGKDDDITFVVGIVS